MNETIKYGSIKVTANKMPYGDKVIAQNLNSILEFCALLYQNFLHHLLPFDPKRTPTVVMPNRVNSVSNWSSLTYSEA